MQNAKPLVCEFIFRNPLEKHTEDLRSWIAGTGELTIEALRNSNTIENCSDVLDSRLWDSSFSLGEPPQLRISKLSERAWKGLRSSVDLRGIGIAMRPRPHAPEMQGQSSMIDLSSAWYPAHPNWVSWKLPVRFLAGVTPEWESRLTANLKAFAQSARAYTAFIGFMQPLAFTAHPLGQVDYGTHILGVGWAMVLGESHIDRLGGIQEIADCGLFEKVERLTGDGSHTTYYLKSKSELPTQELQPGGSFRAALEAFMGPILPPKLQYPPA